MNKFRMLLCALLALATAAIYAPALAEELQFVPGEDLVLVDQDGVRVTLKGEQPAEINENTYGIGFFVENSRPESIAIGIVHGTEVNGMEILAQNVTASHFQRVLKNCSMDCKLEIKPLDIAWQNDAGVEDYEQIASFDRIATMTFCFVAGDSEFERLIDFPTVTVRF